MLLYITPDEVLSMTCKNIIDFQHLYTSLSCLRLPVTCSPLNMLVYTAVNGKKHRKLMKAMSKSERK